MRPNGLSLNCRAISSSTVLPFFAGAGAHQLVYPFGLRPAGQDGVEANAFVAQFQRQGLCQPHGGCPHAVRKHQVGQRLFDRVGSNRKHTGCAGLFQVTAAQRGSTEHGSARTGRSSAARPHHQILQIFRVADRPHWLPADPGHPAPRPPVRPAVPGEGGGSPISPAKPNTLSYFPRGDLLGCG